MEEHTDSDCTGTAQGLLERGQEALQAMSTQTEGAVRV